MNQKKNEEVIYLNAALENECPAVHAALTEAMVRRGVKFGYLPASRNIWCRDYMPIALPSGGYAEYRYYPDYLRDYKKYQSWIMDWRKMSGMGDVCTDSTLANIIVDGGNVVRCGKYVVMTEKVFVENPSFERAVLTGMLEQAFEAQVIFLPWDRKEIFGHADGICRYVGNDTVLMTNYRQFDYDMAESFVKRLKPYFKVKELEYETKDGLFMDSWAYINWLQTEECLFVPQLNDACDEQAFEQIGKFFPEYRGRIEMVEARELVKNGGAFNCCSWGDIDIIYNVRKGKMAVDEKKG